MLNKCYLYCDLNKNKNYLNDLTDILSIQLTLQGQKEPNTQEFLYQGEEGAKWRSPRSCWLKEQRKQSAPWSWMESTICSMIQTLRSESCHRNCAPRPAPV